MNNANIKSLEEAVKRLINGEIFYYGDYIVFCDIWYLKSGENPFRVDDGSYSFPIPSNFILSYKEWGIHHG